MHVDRCVCFDVTFARLKSHLEAHGGGLDEIQRTFGCGRGCGLCIPYIRRMIRTGETTMPLMNITTSSDKADRMQADSHD